MSMKDQHREMAAILLAQTLELEGLNSSNEDTALKIAKMAKEEIDRIEAIEEDKRPKFGVIAVGPIQLGHARALVLAEHLLRHEVPIIVVSTEESKGAVLDEDEEDVMRKIARSIEPRPVMKLEIDPYKLGNDLQYAVKEKPLVENHPFAKFKFSDHKGKHGKRGRRNKW